MNIDERGRRAGTDLLERAVSRPIPELDAPDAQTRRDRVMRVVAAAVAAALVLVAIGVVVTRGDDSVRTIASLPVPDGVQARSWSPVGLGVTLAVPTTWVDGGPRSGFRYSTGDPAGGPYVLADRIRNVRALDLDAVGSSRAADLNALGATGITKAPVDLGGRRAIELKYRLNRGTGPVASATEYDLVDGDWLFLVAVGEHEPIDHQDLSDWVASTIQLRPLGSADLAFSTSIRQPDRPLGTPAGVDPVEWAPTGLGASMQVPSTWQETATKVAGFDHAIRLPTGGPTVMASRISSTDASKRESFLRGIGAEIQSSVDTTVDGHPARAIRYWIAGPDYPLRVTLDVEYVIDVDAANDILVTTAEFDGGNDDSAVLQWVRSTIRIS